MSTHRTRKIGFHFNHNWLGAFAFAYDLFLVAKDEISANKQLNIVSKWADYYNMIINTSKP